MLRNLIKTLAFLIRPFKSAIGLKLLGATGFTLDWLRIYGSRAQQVLMFLELMGKEKKWEYLTFQNEIHFLFYTMLYLKTSQVRIIQWQLI